MFYIIGKPVHLIQWCPICNNHAFVGWAAQLIMPVGPKWNVTEFPANVKQFIHLLVLTLLFWDVWGIELWFQWHCLWDWNTCYYQVVEHECKVCIVSVKCKTVNKLSIHVYVFYNGDSVRPAGVVKNFNVGYILLTHRSHGPLPTWPIISWFTDFGHAWLVTLEKL